MHDATTPPNRFDQACRHIFGFLGQAALVLVVWLGLMKFPNAPAADLDPSWRMVLGFAQQHGLQFGTELVFNYGPLGYLLPATNMGALYAHHVAWQLAANGVIALSIYALGRRFSGWRLGLYYAYFLFFGVGYVDVVHMIAILLFGLALLREGVVSRPWLAALLSAGLGLLSVVKFTNLMLAGFIVLCVVGFHAWRHRWRDAAVVGVAAVVGFLGSWVAWGQHLGNLPAYLINSLAISSGYVEGMGLDGPTSILLLALGALAAIGLYLALTLVRPVDAPRALAAALIAAAASFLNWKHGFVRADGHVLAHFFICLFFAVSAPVLLQDEGPFRRTKGALLALAGLLSLAGIALSSPVTVTDAATSLNYRLKDSVRQLIHLPQFAEQSRTEYKAASELYVLPAAQSLVGQGSVDVLGNEQAYALFNHLTYRPRPVIQSFSTFNERLQRLNGDFIASARAPEFFLQKVQTIDHRLPSLDDSLLTRYLYHHYTYLLDDHDFLVWRRNAPDAALDRQTPLSSATLKFGERLVMPSLGDTPIWCELDLRPSLLGRLRDFVYKPPTPMLAVADGSSVVNSYRIVPGMARAGFLVYPHFTGNYGIKAFERGGPGPRITAFSVELDPALRRYFQSDIHVRFFTLPPFPRAHGEDAVAPEVRYRVFSQVPSVVNAPFPTDILVENHKEVLLAHPPSSIEFELAPANRHATGHFGLVANAYTNGNTTDGAEFIIEWINAKGEVSRVFYRLLKPLTVPGDRGEQSFDFVVPPGGGRLVLRTTPGPDENIAFDWTYWTDVKFAP